MKTSGALVIFVKTPGLTPAKTRLAAGIGRDMANQFYQHALSAISAVAKNLKKKLPDLQIYWAVAEDQGLNAEIWSEFPTLSQGNGSLGDRLSFVYNTILQKHSFACFIGADSPHLTTDELYSGVLATANNLKQKFVLGETEDGGFYFFGGGMPLPQSLWQAVEYSCSKTSAQLKLNLSTFGEVQAMTENFDIDIVEDLKKYTNASWIGSDLLPEQITLIQWVQLLNLKTG